jgi:hypothetical protein
MQQTHPCKYLRTKNMLTLASKDKAPAGRDEWGASPCYWCNLTLTVVGPDDQPVGIQVCSPPRVCAEE